MDVDIQFSKGIVWMIVIIEVIIVVVTIVLDAQVVIVVDVDIRRIVSCIVIFIFVILTS